MTLPLLTTKLHRPLALLMQVPRPHLLAKLNQGLARGDKLILVVAPAGFGKTTLISQWIEQHAELSDTATHGMPRDWRNLQSRKRAAWLALDEADNDLAFFLQQVVAVVQRIYPTACTNFLDLLQAPQLPSVPYLVTVLRQELAALPTSFVLVLEDYHFVTETTVHQLLTLLLDHLPAQIHLVLISRTEPPLPLARLRVRQQMTELRTADLYFSLAETQTFLSRALDRPLSYETIHILHTQTEGWIAGLQLAALALRGNVDERAFVKAFAAGNRHVMDYLMGEVLVQQPQAVQTFLLYTSILDNFCAPLCEAVLGGEAQRAPFASSPILTYLAEANLFVISLDDEDRWYRYHHLFRLLLRRRLHVSATSVEIEALHRRASVWLAANGWIEEAVRHALAGGDNLTAAHLVTQHRQEMFNREEWRTLERWLGLLPAALVEQDAALLITKAFVYSFQFKLAAIPPLLQAAATCLDASPLTGAAAQMLRGELASLWSQHWFWQNEYGRSLAAVQQEMAHLSATHLYARSGALFYWALAAQMMGQRALAVQRLQAILAEQQDHPSTLITRVLFALTLIHYLAGELARAQQIAQDFLQVAMQSHLSLSQAWAHYMLGLIHYEWNELEPAAHHFAAVVAQRYASHILAVHNCWLALAWTQQAQGHVMQAKEQVTELLNFHYQQNNLALLSVVHAFQARLALQQGNTAAAIRWAQAVRPHAQNGPPINFEQPEFTYVRVLLAEATVERRSAAGAELTQLQDVATSTHNTLRLIEVLALQALAAALQGEIESALTTLTQAVRLAKLGGFIRTFVDLGPSLAGLLYQLVARGVEAEYLGRVLAAFPPITGAASAAQQIRRAAQVNLIEPLTERESEVLLYLKQGLSNKAIAHTLNISALTVKKHTINLYQKLGVNSRQQANVKAQALGILPIDNGPKARRA